MQEHFNDIWSLAPYRRMPEDPTVYESESAWQYPDGEAGYAMTSYEGAQEYTALQLLALSSGEVVYLTMLAPNHSLITIQAAEQ